MNAVAIFVIMIGTVLAAVWTLTYGRNMVARARFVGEMTRLRNQVEFDVFGGELPDTEAVQYLWARASAMTRRPEMISLSHMLAIVAQQERGGLSTPMRPSVGDLTPEQRKRFHQYERTMVGHLRTYVLNGSRLWFMLRLVAMLPDSLRGANRSDDVAEVAEKYSKILDKSSVRTDRGPRVSPMLLPH